MSNTENTRKNKALSPWAVRVIFIIMAIGIVRIYVYLKGNPLTGMGLNKKADRYLHENYPEIAGQVYRSRDAYFVKVFDFRPQSMKEDSEADGRWYIYYSSENDPFMHFNLCYSRNGELIYDGCKENYLKGGTIYEYYSDEYRSFIVDIHNEIYNNGMPKSGISVSSVVGGTSAEAYFADVHNAAHYSEYLGPVLDVKKEYTMEELASEYGHIDFNYDVSAEERTIENLYARRIEMRNIIDEYNIPAKTFTVSFRLFEGAYNMPVSALYSDNLMEQLEEYYVNIYK